MSVFNFEPQFCMEEAGGGEGGGAAGAGAGGEGGAGAGEGGSGQQGQATAHEGGGKAPFGQTPTGQQGGEGGEGGSQKLDMAALLGEELAGNKSLEKYMGSENPVQELGKALIHAQSQAGKQQYTAPPEDASEEQKAAYRESIGVPKDAAGYEFKQPENWPEGLPYDQEHADSWAQKFLDKGVPATVANDLRNDFMAEMIEGAAAQQAEANEALNTVFTEQFGDKAGAIAKEVGAVMKEAIPDDAVRAQIEAALGDEQTPAFGQAIGAVIQHMKAKYGMADENIGGEGGGTGGKSEADLRAEASKLMASDAYRDTMHPEHQSVKDQVNGIYKQVGQLRDAQASAKN